jgi:hypothetical protein
VACIIDIFFCINSTIARLCDGETINGVWVEGKGDCPETNCIGGCGNNSYKEKNYISNAN